MNNEFYPLDCDDDVVLLNEDTFKISRLKELAKKTISNKWQGQIYNYQTRNADVSIHELFSHVSIGAVTIKLSEIKYTAVIDCEILRIGGKGWQKGKLKIKLYRSPSNSGDTVYEAYLEFCPDQPKEPESPLDDIRKMLKDEQ